MDKKATTLCITCLLKKEVGVGVKNSDRDLLPLRGHLPSASGTEPTMETLTQLNRIEPMSGSDSRGKLLFLQLSNVDKAFHSFSICVHIYVHVCWYTHAHHW